MHLKRQTVFCREAWYYLLVLGFVVTGALLREINLLVMVAGMMLGPLLFNWRSAILSLRGLEAARKLPRALCAGDLITVDVQLTCARKRRDSRAVIVDDLIVRETGAWPLRSTASVLFPHLPAGEVHHRTYQGRITERGRYRFGPLRLSTRYPLGLVRRTVTLDVTDRLIVYPRLGRLTGAWQRRRHEALTGSRRRRGPRGSGDFFALRDWRSGDSRRWIHWRTSARRGSLVVRQFEQQQNDDLLLLVDLWQPRAPSEDDLERVETAISFAATVVADVCRRGGSRLHLGVTGGEVAFTRGEASMGMMSDLLEELAVVQASRHDRLDALLAGGLEGITPGMTLALVSTRALNAPEGGRLARLPLHLSDELAGVPLTLIDAGSPDLEEYFHVQS